MSDNGTLEASTREVRLSPVVLRRLARLHARAEGAQLVAKATEQAMQQTQAALREALTEACEEEGMTVPGSSTASVDVDWRTGVVTVSPPAPDEERTMTTSAQF